MLALGCLLILFTGLVVGFVRLAAGCFWLLVAFVLLGLLAAGWVCLAWFASGCLLPAFGGSLLAVHCQIACWICFGFAFRAWHLLLQFFEGYSAKRFFPQSSLKMLYESPGGNQVDDLPPALISAARKILIEVRL